MQPAGGVNEHGVHRCSFRCGPRRTRRWPGLPLGPRTVGAPSGSPRSAVGRPPRPGRCRPRRAAPNDRPDEHPRGACQQVVVLPVPFTPTTSSTAGRPDAQRMQRPVRGAHGRDQLLASRARTSSRERVPATSYGSGAGPRSPGCTDPDIGGQQSVLDFLPGILVEHIPDNSVSRLRPVGPGNARAALVAGQGGRRSARALRGLAQRSRRLSRRGMRLFRGRRRFRNSTVSRGRTGAAGPSVGRAAAGDGPGHPATPTMSATTRIAPIKMTVSTGRHPGRAGSIRPRQSPVPATAGRSPW